jgi:hypothetical protein
MRDAGERICAPGVFTYSPTTGEQYSASPGDYWNHPDDQPLKDSEGSPMILASERTEIIPL